MLTFSNGYYSLPKSQNTHKRENLQRKPSLNFAAQNRDDVIRHFQLKQNLLARQKILINTQYESVRGYIGSLFQLMGGTEKDSNWARWRLQFAKAQAMEALREQFKVQRQSLIAFYTEVATAKRLFDQADIDYNRQLEKLIQKPPRFVVNYQNTPEQKGYVAAFSPIFNLTGRRMQLLSQEISAQYKTIIGEDLPTFEQWYTPTEPEKT